MHYNVRKQAILRLKRSPAKNELIIREEIRERSAAYFSNESVSFKDQLNFQIDSLLNECGMCICDDDDSCAVC